MFWYKFKCKYNKKGRGSDDVDDIVDFVDVVDKVFDGVVDEFYEGHVDDDVVLLQGGVALQHGLAQGKAYQRLVDRSHSSRCTMLHKYAWPKYKYSWEMKWIEIQTHM